MFSITDLACSGAVAGSRGGHDGTASPSSGRSSRLLLYVLVASVIILVLLLLCIAFIIIR